MADKKLNAFTPAAAWTITSSVVGSDSASPTGSFSWTRAEFDAVYGQLFEDNSWSGDAFFNGLATFTAGISAIMASAGITLAIGRSDGGQNRLVFDSNGRALMQTGGAAQMAWIGDQLAIRMAANTLFGFSSNTSAQNADNDTTFLRDGPGIFGVYANQGGGAAHGGAMHFGRSAADADFAAPTDGFTFFSKQVGGKNALFVRFPTGAVQQLAIEL